MRHFNRSRCPGVQWIQFWLKICSIIVIWAQWIDGSALNVFVNLNQVIKIVSYTDCKTPAPQHTKRNERLGEVTYLNLQQQWLNIPKRRRCSQIHVPECCVSIYWMCDRLVRPENFKVPKIVWKLSYLFDRLAIFFPLDLGIFVGDKSRGSSSSHDA